MDDTDDAVIHAIDRTITDLLPDKHLYEPDLQLYLDYSLPPHPDLEPLKESEEADEHDSEPDYVILSGDLTSRSSTRLEGALQQSIPDQPSAEGESSTELLIEAGEALQDSAQGAAEAIQKVEAHQDSSTAAAQDRARSDSGEGTDEGDAFSWPALTTLSDATKSTVPPVDEPAPTASQESSTAIQEGSGCEESGQQVPQPGVSDQTEPPLEPSHDAGHLMPLRRPEAGDALALTASSAEAPSNLDSLSLQHSDSNMPCFVFIMHVVDRIRCIVQVAKAQEQRQREGC